MQFLLSESMPFGLTALGGGGAAWRRGWGRGREARHRGASGERQSLPETVIRVSFPALQEAGRHRPSMPLSTPHREGGGTLAGVAHSDPEEGRTYELQRTRGRCGGGGGGSVGLGGAGCPGEDFAHGSGVWAVSVSPPPRLLAGAEDALGGAGPLQ